MLRLQKQKSEVVFEQHRHFPLLSVHLETPVDGRPHQLRQVRLDESNTFVLSRSLKMDRWKLKELYQMELGGNKNALEYYTQHDMIKDGKPDHEAAPHARWKHDLASWAESLMKANNVQVAPAAPK